MTDTEDLQAIVTNFNNAFVAWMAKTGCHANFGWTYTPERVKTLELLDIKKTIYVKPISRGVRDVLNSME